MGKEVGYYLHVHIIPLAYMSYGTAAFPLKAVPCVQVYS